jgi:hypothetical protein
MNPLIMYEHRCTKNSLNIDLSWQICYCYKPTYSIRLRLLCKVYKKNKLFFFWPKHLYQYCMLLKIYKIFVQVTVLKNWVVEQILVDISYI